MIALDGVSVGYRSRPEPTVAGVSVTVESGEWLAVIGPNGSGKSTLLKGLVGILPVTGEITVNERSAPTQVERSRAMAFVPQVPALPVGLTTAEYVLLGRSNRLRWFQGESAADRDRAAAVIDELNLADLADRAVTELSGGEVQRAALARALVQDAPVLVLDEPTSALDLAHQIGVLELIDSLRLSHSLTVVSAMHDLNLASRFARRLLLINRGRQVAVGAGDEVLTADVLSAQFETPVSVERGPDGGLVILPMRTAAVPSGTAAETRIETTDQGDR